MSVVSRVAEVGWTSARVASLVAHYQAGLSAAKSAALLGDASRNAVISKRRRLGLLATAPLCAAVLVGPAAGSGRHDRESRLRLFRGPPPMPSGPLPDMEGPLPLQAAPRPLAQRAVGECAWPLGPAEEAGSHLTLFCSAPVAVGRSYCPTHAARAFRCGDGANDNERRG
jgi:hypothetical protein